MKVVLNSAIVECGVQFVMIAGELLMLELCADNWDYQQLVCMCVCVCMYVYVCVCMCASFVSVCYSILNYSGISFILHDDTSPAILNTGVSAVSFAVFGPGTGPIWLDDVRCFGTESRLASCRANPIGSHNCGHYEDAGVRCGRRRGENLAYYN